MACKRSAVRSRLAPPSTYVRPRPSRWSPRCLISRTRNHVWARACAFAAGLDLTPHLRAENRLLHALPRIVRRIQIDRDPFDLALQAPTMPLDHGIGERNPHSVQVRPIKRVLEARARRLRRQVLAIDPHRHHRSGIAGEATVGKSVDLKYCCAHDVLWPDAVERAALNIEVPHMSNIDSCGSQKRAQRC